MNHQVCQICQSEKSKFLLRNKPVCLTCDELIFDLELELEETSTEDTATRDRADLAYMSMAKN